MQKQRGESAEPEAKINKYLFMQILFHMGVLFLIIPV